MAFALGLSAPVLAADEGEEVSPEMLAAAQKQLKKNDYYMRNIRPVYFPPVPYGWKIEIAEDNTVSYIHSKSSETKSQSANGDKAGTTIKMRYTRRTNGKDAASFMDDYVQENSCEDKTQQGNGFYTTSCGVSNTYAIVIGEPDNMYIIELVGNYSSAASAIIGNYVNAIVSGKKVFKDRNIGELNRDSANLQE